MGHGQWGPRGAARATHEGRAGTREERAERAAAHYAEDLRDLTAWAWLEDPQRAGWDHPTTGAWAMLERRVTLDRHPEAPTHAGRVGMVMQHRETGRDVLVIGREVVELPGGYAVAVERGTIRETPRLRHFTVQADAYTGAWISEPEETGTVEREAWAAKQDTHAEHFDTYEADGETHAVTVRWVK